MSKAMMPNMHRNYCKVLYIAIIIIFILSYFRANDWMKLSPHHTITASSLREISPTFTPSTTTRHKPSAVTNTRSPTSPQQCREQFSTRDCTSRIKRLELCWRLQIWWRISRWLSQTSQAWSWMKQQRWGLKMWKLVRDTQCPLVKEERASKQDKREHRTLVLFPVRGVVRRRAQETCAQGT